MNFGVPPSTSPGPTSVSVRAAGSEIASGTVAITSVGPGLFVNQPVDPSQPGAIENQDYSLNSESNPAKAGSVVQIFSTGIGPPSGNGSVSVVVAGTPAQVLYSGPVTQYPGLWQINAQVPADLSGQVSMDVIAGNAASNAVTLWVD